MAKTRVSRPSSQPDFRHVDPKRRQAAGTPNYVIERAKGDGNCAFNAFVLGFCTEEVLDQIELDPTNKPLMKAFADIAKKLKVNASLAWPEKLLAVKGALLGLRKKDKDKLQVTLAPIMRQLAIDLARVDEEYFALTLPGLARSYYDFVFEQLELPRRGGRPDDDVYKFDFIDTKYFELLQESVAYLNQDQEIRQLYNRTVRQRQKTVDEEAELNAILFQEPQAKLLDWWEVEGFSRFLNAMSRNRTWGGDHELGRLAKCFKVNLHILNRGDCGRFDGEMPNRYSYQVIEELSDRGVIQRPVKNNPAPGLSEAARRQETIDFYKETKNLKLMPLTREAVAARLRPVPDLDVVLRYIEQHRNRLDDESISKTNKPVPDHWSAACLKELAARNIIERRNGQAGYIFSVVGNIAEARSKGLDRADEIEKAYWENRKFRPTITLTNKSAAHWDNVQVVKDSASANRNEDKSKTGVTVAKTDSALGGFFAFRSETIRMTGSDAEEKQKKYAQQASAWDQMVNLVINDVDAAIIEFVEKPNGSDRLSKAYVKNVKYDTGTVNGKDKVFVNVPPELQEAMDKAYALKVQFEEACSEEAAKKPAKRP